jgi:hypothetical protein
VAIQIQNTGVRTLTIFEDEFPYVINKLTCNLSVRSDDGLIVFNWWNIGKASTVHELSFNFSDVTSPEMADVDALHDWILNQLENLGGDLSYESPVMIQKLRGVDMTQAIVSDKNQILVTAQDGEGNFYWTIENK